MSNDSLKITYADSLAGLADVLSEARRPGDYFAAGILETPMPLLKVEGVGVVSFPVPPEQCRRMIEAAAERAPYGRGADTLVDESVRKVWQIAPSRVELSGKRWNSTLERIVAEVAEGLSCEEAEVEAEFYKLLIYDEGGFFLPHRDSEKAGGMFGTLVISLPSEHQGGELIIRHGGRETVQDLRVSDPGELRYAAFYADCEHEVRPILSGYRVCLIYNLVQRRATAESRISPPEDDAIVEAASKILRKWAEADEVPAKVAYLLEHHYTTAGLSFASLKGADAALAKALRRAAAEAGVAMYLGIVHIEESGWAEYSGGGYHYRGRRWDDNDEPDDDDYSVGEVCDGERYLNDWRALDDKAVSFGKIPLDEGEVLPVGALDGEEPDELHFSEATGNAGASFERTYLRAALVLWPHDRFDAICASAGTEAALARLGQRVDEATAVGDSERKEADAAVRRLAEIVYDRWPTYGDRAPALSSFLGSLARFGDPGLIREFALPLLPGSYSGAQNEALVSAMKVLGPAGAREALAPVLSELTRIVPGSCIDLWIRLSEPFKLDPEAFLSKPLSSLMGGIRTVKGPAAHHVTAADFYRTKGAIELSPGLLRSFFAALKNSACANQSEAAARALAENPAVFAPEDHILPMLSADSDSADELRPEAEDILWRHCAEFFLRRGEHPPEEPKDWAQRISLPEPAPVLRELESFAANPLMRECRFRKAAEERSILQQAIREHNLDMTCVTEEKGRPYTLICTKNRASYARARRRHQQDIQAMQKLLDHTPEGVDGGYPSRLRKAIERA